jgi:hypothetical protein
VLALNKEQVVTALSVHFSRALAKGRRIEPLPQSRPQLLATLLRKRAAAHVAGADELESLLRDQIRWSLPVDKDPDGNDPTR